MDVNQKPFYQKHPKGPLGLLHPFAYSDSIMRFYNFHWHSFVEIVYGIKGSIWLSVDGRSHEIRPRDMAFINSGSIHGYWGASPGTVTGLLEVRLELFDDVFLENSCLLSPNGIFGAKTFFTLDEGDNIHRRLEDCFLAIREEYDSQKKGAYLAIKTKLYEMALIFIRELSGGSANGRTKNTGYNTNHEVLERVFYFIHEQYRNPDFTLEAMANSIGMSKFYFTRFFRKFTGQTFHSYISTFRINHAKKCLLESNRTIMDIALDCGFGSKETFNRLFKQHTGIVPSLYRDKERSVFPV
ncbi:MAG: AraC family transcriptional regulator [Treponema sp.]|jgi:AraC-like DNA-binding protein|nr:AraC family transcriptional regulator [Treponema sp.]